MELDDALDVIYQCDHIEILPPHLIPENSSPEKCIYEDGVLGIPQKLMQKKFASIRSLYTRLAGESHHKLSDTECKQLYKLTTLCLIVTTENVLALNSRRRVTPASLLYKDLLFLNVLFRSPLQKHTKSPMLWNHRRWLITQLHSVEEYQKHLTTGDFGKLSTVSSHDWLNCEFLIVLKAGMLHPRNYYSWAHARWIVQEYKSSLDLNCLAEWLFVDVCSRNVSDISMWSFMEFVLDTIDNRQLSTGYVGRALALTDLAPGHETMWTFIGNMTGKLKDKSLIDSIEEVSTIPRQGAWPSKVLQKLQVQILPN
uniref:ARAD1D42130p n=1 Tax=Blastobotrys adeninivorans TaxID=409370 RepID=A0A060TDB5_BLAAD